MAFHSWQSAYSEMQECNFKRRVNVMWWICVAGVPVDVVVVLGVSADIWLLPQPAVLCVSLPPFSLTDDFT